MFGRPFAISGLKPGVSRFACRSATSQAGSGNPQAKGAGGNRMLKAAITSGTFSILGDLLAQLLPQRHKLRKSGGRLDWDYVRTLRMGGFGFVFYGPYQSKWYAALDSKFPSTGWSNFLTKVVLNQIALSPVVLAVVFSWNLTLTGQAKKVPSKIRNDLVPTMINGWKFWVPASSINFAVIPLQHQVLYMSICSVLWTAYLSHASNG